MIEKTQLDIMYKEYLNGKSTVKLAKEYNLRSSTIAYFFKKMDIV